METEFYGRLLDIATFVRYRMQDQAPQEDQDLCGWCAIASAELWKELHKHGVKAELRVWTAGEHDDSAHVFVVVQDWILDITASQFFELRDVEVFLKHEKDQAFYFYESVHAFETPKHLKKWQLKSGWPVDQIALT